jgi:hypothetical protein
MQVVSRASQTLLTIFGKGHPRRGSPEESLKDSVAKRAGFADADALERAKRFVALPVEEQERFFAERENAAKGAVPDRDLANPQRRAQNVAEQAEDAPDKESEIRSWSVSVGREDVKVEAEQYLRQHYRNADGEMTCQICKAPLPFKLDDGSEFFETVEFLPDLRSVVSRTISHSAQTTRRCTATQMGAGRSSAIWSRTSAAMSLRSF